MIQPSLFGSDIEAIRLQALESYDKILIGFSGGKDSLATLLQIIDACWILGIDPAAKVELWHHCVDGDPNVESPLFDWPCTVPYCKAIAAELGLPLYLSWREGGFLREMNRKESATAPVVYERPGGQRITGGLGPPNTRGLFPQVSADLSVRWCSAYLKIMVASSAIASDPRFDHARILFCTGERWEESTARSKYKNLEYHRSHTKSRLVHHYRPVLEWPEQDVWKIIERKGLLPHPCYYLGYGRASCETCIFSGAEEWATLAAIHPDRFQQLAAMEKRTGKTIHRKLSIVEQAAKGTPLASTLYWQEQALVRFDAPIRPAVWELPSGAYRKGNGPS